MGSVICIGAGMKGELANASNQNNVFGILLEDTNTAVDAAFSNGTITASVGRRGSYKVSQIIVSAGVDATILTNNLRQQVFCWREIS